MYDAILKEKSSDFSDLKSCELFNLVKKKKHLMLSECETKLSDGKLVTLLVLGSRVKIFPIGLAQDVSNQKRLPQSSA